MLQFAEEMPLADPDTMRRFIEELRPIPQILNQDVGSPTTETRLFWAIREAIDEKQWFTSDHATKTITWPDGTKWRLKAKWSGPQDFIRACDGLSDLIWLSEIPGIEVAKKEHPWRFAWGFSSWFEPAE